MEAPIFNNQITRASQEAINNIVPFNPEVDNGQNFASINENKSFNLSPEDLVEARKYRLALLNTNAGKDETIAKRINSEITTIEEKIRLLPVDIENKSYSTIVIPSIYANEALLKLQTFTTASKEKSKPVALQIGPNSYLFVTHGTQNGLIQTTNGQEEITDNALKLEYTFLRIPHNAKVTAAFCHPAEALKRIKDQPNEGRLADLKIANKEEKGKMAISWELSPTGNLIVNLKSEKEAS